MKLVELGLSRFVVFALCSPLVRAAPERGKGKSLKRKGDETRDACEVQLTFSGCTAYPYKVCHCFVIPSAFLWHMKNILVIPLYCHLSPGTVDNPYIVMYINVYRGCWVERTFRLDTINHEGLNSGLYAHFVDRFRFVLNHFIHIFAQMKLWYLLYNTMNPCKIL